MRNNTLYSDIVFFRSLLAYANSLYAIIMNFSNGDRLFFSLLLRADMLEQSRIVFAVMLAAILMDTGAASRPY